MIALIFYKETACYKFILDNYLNFIDSVLFLVIMWKTKVKLFFVIYLEYRRTKYTKRQIAELNKAFNRSVYLTIKERNELSKKLNISEIQIKNWFQNKRMKAKRDFIHSVHHGQIIPLKNPSIPKYSRLPDNFFMSLTVPCGDYILGKC